MNDNPTWQVARLDDIERRGRDIPVREHLGIHAFGINAYTPGEDGTLISEHDEAGSGQEELYIVLDGRPPSRSTARRSTRPQGRSCSSGRSRGGRRPGTEPSSRSARHPARRIRGSTGGGVAVPQRVHEGLRRTALRRRARSGRGALERMPDHAGLHYNYACFATLAGDTGDETFAHLRRSVELFPRFREDARRDDDFAAVRDDPRFEEALR